MGQGVTEEEVVHVEDYMGDAGFDRGGRRRLEGIGEALVERGGGGRGGFWRRYMGSWVC